MQLYSSLACFLGGDTCTYIFLARLSLQKTVIVSLVIILVDQWKTVKK